MFTKNHFTLPLYIPRILRQWHNWPEYLFNYATRRDKPAEYRMRNGMRLVDTRGGMAGTIAVVFVRQEYGALDRFETIVDVGANRGTFAIHAALGSPDAKVYCYEPERANFICLKRNIESNGLDDRVAVVERAVAADDRPRDLAVGDSLSNSFYIIPPRATHQMVSCTTLSDIFANHDLKGIDLLKINCEGAEYEILESCSDDDFERIRNIRLEYHNMGSPKRTGRSLAQFLETRGYRIERFTRYRNTSGFIWAARAMLAAFVPEAAVTFLWPIL